jgi:hypothetical protein
MSNWRTRYPPDSIQIRRFPGGNFASLVTSHDRWSLLPSIRRSRNAAQPQVFPGIRGAAAGRHRTPKHATATAARHTFRHGKNVRPSRVAAVFILSSAVIAAQATALDSTLVAADNRRH